MAFETIGIQLLFLGVGEFRRDADAVRRDADSIEKSFQRLQDKTLSFTDQIRNLGAGMISAGRSMTLGLTIPIGILAASVGTAGIKFENAFQGIAKNIEGAAVGFAEIAAVAEDKLGITVTTMDEARAAAEKLGMEWGTLTPLGRNLWQQFVQMGRDIPISTIELAKLGEAVAMLGVQAADLPQVTAMLAMIGDVTDISATEAADGLIHIRNVANDAGLSVEEFVRRAGSALVGLSNDSAATGSEILNLATRIAAAGGAAKFTGPEIFAWGGTLADVGSRAEAGGTAVSRAINNIVLAVATGDESLATFAQVAGQSVDEFTRAFQEDASGALLNFIEKLRIAVKEGKISKDMLNEMGLGGVRAFDIISRLGEATDKYTKNLNTANKAWAEGIAIQDTAQKRWRNIEDQVQILKNRFTELGTVLIARFGGALLDVIDWAKSVVDWFINLDEGTQGWIVKIGLVVAAIGPLLVLGGMLVSAFASIMTAVSALAGPVGIAVAVIAGLAAIIEATGQRENVIRALGEAFKGLEGILSTLFSTVGGLASGKISLADLIPPDVARMATEVATAFQGTADGVRSIIQAFAGLGKIAILDELNAQAQGSGFLDLLSEIGQTIGRLSFESFTQTLRDISRFGQDFSTAFTPFVESAGPQLEQILGNLRDALAEVGPLLEAVNRLGQAMGAEIDWGAVGTVLGQIAGLAFSGLISVLEFITGTLPGAIQQLTAFIQNLTTGADNVRNFGDQAMQAIQNLPQVFDQFFSDLLGEERWAKLQEVPGKLAAIFDAIVGKIQEKLGLLGAWIQTNVLTPIGTAFSNAWSSIKKGVDDFIEKFGLAERFAEIKEAVMKIASDLWTGVVDIFNKMKEGAQKAIQELVDGIIETVDNMYNEIVGHSIVPDLVTGVLAEFENMKNMGLEIFRGFVDGIVGIGETLKTTIGGIISGIFGGGGGQVALPGIGGGLDIAAQAASIQQAITTLITSMIEAQVQVGVLQEAFAGFISYLTNSFLTLQPILVGVFLTMVESFLSGFIYPSEAAFTAFVGVLQGQATFIDAFWLDLVKHMYGHWLDFVAGALALTAMFVDATINAFDTLHNQAVGKIHGLRDDFKNALNEMSTSVDTELVTSLGRAVGAFGSLKAAAKAAADAAVKELRRICEAAREAQACITGSPELIIQHPFELLEKYLKQSDLPNLVQQTIAPVSAFDLARIQGILPATTTNQTSIDNSRSIEVNASGGEPSSITDAVLRSARLLDAQVRIP